MFLGESLRMAARSLWAHRMRSVLTILGVILGIGAVLAVVTIGQSFERSIVSGFNTVDDRTIFVTCDMAQQSSVGRCRNSRPLSRSAAAAPTAGSTYWTRCSRVPPGWPVCPGWMVSVTRCPP